MRIKLSVPGDYPEADLRQFLDSRISGTEFVLNASEFGVFDAWFIFEETLPEDNKALVPRNRVFFLGAETARPLGFYYSEPGWLDYLAQFQAVYSPQELYTDHAHLTFPFLPWMVNANHGPELFATASRGISFFQGLRTVEKTKELSVFCSAKTLTPGHRVRLEFVRKLKTHFGDSLDWFGNGVNSVEEKWDGLAPYKYCLVLENQSTSYVLTEKIQDAFLSLSMPLYWGAPEASSLFPRESFVPVNLKDFGQTVTTIANLLKKDPYQEVLPHLIEAKRVVTEELNFLSRISAIATDPIHGEAHNPTLVEIRPINDGQKSKSPPELDTRGLSRGLLKRRKMWPNSR